MGVPFARRSLFESRTRVLVAVGGVTLAMTLVIALDGIFAAMLRQATAYIDLTPFDIAVSQEGVRNLHMTSSQFPLSDNDRIGRVSGVRQADAILFTTAYVVSGDNRNLVYLIGYQNGKLGGPPPSADVPRELGKDEVVMDRRVAQESGISVGDTVTILGKDFKVAGFVAGTVSVTNSVAYIRFEDFERATGLRQTQSFTLVRARPGEDPGVVAARIREKVSDVTVQTRRQFADSERRVISDMGTDILRIMTAIGFAIGLAVVALTVYTATLGKLNEYGVLKAVGAPSRRIYATVLAQAAMSVGLGLAVAVALTLALGAVLGLADVGVRVLVEPSSVLRVALGAAVVAVIASALPIVRVASIEPAEVFRH